MVEERFGSPAFPIQEKLARNIVDCDGDEGREFLRRLPQTIAGCEAEWQITVQPAFPDLSYNFVAPAVRADGTPVVLKLSRQHALDREIEALQLFGGAGACLVLEADLERGRLLLERLLPGIELRSLTDDDQATRIAADVMRRLWRPAPEPCGLQTLEERGRGFERLRAAFGGTTGPFPQRLVEQAECVFRDFPQGVATMVLHGDCHHYNILLTEGRGRGGVSGWVAIDPHGVVGDPGYEVGCFIYNPGGHLDPLNQPDPHRYIARRVDLLSECLNWERERVRGWCLAQSVLSSWWTYEDHGRYDPDTIVVGESLEKI